MGSYKVWNSNGDGKLVENVTTITRTDWVDSNYSSNNLTKVEIFDNITSIGGDAFYGCSGLTSITIPDSVTSIGDYAFGGCSKLTSITIPDSVTSIRDYVFYDCSGLTSITMLSPQVTINRYAFFSCLGLKNIYYKGIEAEWSQSMQGDLAIDVNRGQVQPNIICLFDEDAMIVDSNPELGSVKFKLNFIESSTGLQSYIKKIIRYNLQTSFWGEDTQEGFTIYNATSNSSGELTFYDYTCETGVNYTYLIWYGQGDDQEDAWTCKMVIDVQADYEDILLLDKTNTPYRVRYNTTVSGLKKNLQESTTITLGGHYPVVRRNGDSNYYSFTFGGLLSWQQQNNDSYGELSINDRERIERAWRKVSIDYLTNGEVKLFKSPQEGLMLIRITGVNLTPETKLGRNIYSFTATATEVAECTPDNFSKYGMYSAATPNLYAYNTTTGVFFVQKGSDS